MDTLCRRVFDDSCRRRSPLQNEGMIWMLLLACPPDLDSSIGTDSTAEVAVEGVLVAITAPAFGYDLGVSTETVTLLGLAAERVDSLSWTVEGASHQDGGTIALGTEWTLEDVPLAVGDNVVTVEASSEGDVQTDSVVVTYYPDSPFTAGLRVSEGVVFVGETITLEAATQAVPDQGTLTVGTNSAQPWGLLLETAPGWYSGTFELTPSQVETLEVRAFSGDGAATPPVTLEVVERLSDEQWDEALDAYQDIAIDWANEGDVEGALDDAGALWAAIPGGGYSFSVNGLHFAVVPPSERSRGGANVTPLTGGNLSATTVSRSGTAGPLPAGPSRSGTFRTEGRQAVLLSPFSDSTGFGDETPGIQNLLQNAAGCPFPAPLVNTDPAAVGVSVFWESTRHPLVNIATHGALTATDLESGQSRTSSMMWTREVLTDASRLGHEAKLRAGWLVYADPERREGTTTTADPKPTLAITAEGVKNATLSRPMPDSIVVLSACHVGGTPEMAAAYLSKEARSVSAYTDNVQGAFAQQRTTAFWAEVIDAQPAAYAVAVDGSDDGDGTPAKLTHFGEEEVFIGIDLNNPDFDSPLIDPQGNQDPVWTVVPTSQAGLSSVSLEGTGHGLLSSTGKSFTGYVSPSVEHETVAKATQSVCIPANETVTVTFDWQVALDPYNSWGTSQDNALFVRYGEGPAPLVVGWDVIKPATGKQNSEKGWGATGKQTATVTLAGTGSPVDLELIGYGYDASRMDFVFDNLVAN